METSTIMLLAGAGVVIVLLILVVWAWSRGRSEEVTYQSLDPDLVEKMEEEQAEVYNQRFKLFADSMNVIWNALLIDVWLGVDNIADPKDAIKTDTLVFTPDSLCMYSIYVPRSLKVSCQLSWKKQLMYIRVEQQLDNGIISVESNVKLKAGVISVLQAEAISNKYYKALLKLSEGGKTLSVNSDDMNKVNEEEVQPGFMEHVQETLEEDEE